MLILILVNNMELDSSKGSQISITPTSSTLFYHFHFIDCLMSALFPAFGDCESWKTGVWWDHHKSAVKAPWGGRREGWIRLHTWWFSKNYKTSGELVTWPDCKYARHIYLHLLSLAFIIRGWNNGNCYSFRINVELDSSNSLDVWSFTVYGWDQLSLQTYLQYFICR